ncbi:hypothetical protein PENNAL_c0258G02342, partial [Penicillium nalgiovense]
CCASGTLLLDPGVDILPSEAAESPHKTPSPDLRTNLRHSITPGKASHNPRNLTLVPRVDVQDPRSYAGLPGTYVAPRSCLCAPSNRTKVSGSKKTPRVKTCAPSTDRAVN